MEEKDNKVHIDYKTLLNQVAEKAIIDFVVSTLPDDQSKRIIGGLMNIHRKYGIDPATTMKILVDLGEMLKEEEKHE